MATNNKAIQAVTVRPGETVILPAGAVITSVIYDGSVSLTSNCSNILPTPSSYKCGYFHMELDVDSNDGHSMDEHFTYYSNLRVGGTTYNINRLIVYNSENPGNYTSVEVLNTHVPDQALFSFTSINRTVLAKRQIFYLYFKVPEGLFNDTELKLDNRGMGLYLKPIEWECGAYSNP